MPKPVVIQYTKGPYKGAEYVVESEAVAKRVHPDAKVVRYENGDLWVAGKPPKTSKTVTSDAGDSLEAHTVPELEELARDKGISPLPTLKADLIAEIEKA